MAIQSIQDIIKEIILDELKDYSTPRVRKFYKKNKNNIKYLRKTQNKRVERNRDRRAAIKKHGKKKMKKYDVHHPAGVDGDYKTKEKWYLVKKDHGKHKKIKELRLIIRDEITKNKS
jgi:hypothetical protein